MFMGKKPRLVTKLRMWFDDTMALLWIDLAAKTNLPSPRIIHFILDFARILQE